MGDVVHINFEATKSTYVERSRTRVVSADFVEGPSRRTLNSALYNVGFDDALHWRIVKPFQHDYKHRGLVATPHIVAHADDGCVRLVKMSEGKRPNRLDAHSVVTANLDCWVLCARLLGGEWLPEMWVVFDDGKRFELLPAAPLAQAHADLAMREMRVEGLDELSTSEAAALVVPS